MDRGLRNLVSFLSILFLLFVSSCTGPQQEPVDGKIIYTNPVYTQTIGEIQSELTQLTMECKHGKQVACDKVPSKKAQLEIMLYQYYNRK